jgi:CheY-like chemotaxis protein
MDILTPAILTILPTDLLVNLQEMKNQNIGELTMAKILIIDDSSFQRRSIRKILEVDGHEIQEATNGRQGLEKIPTFTPDCILLDILMPDMNGFKFLKALQEQKSTIPVVVLTADIQDTTCQECLKLGAKQVVHKPLLPAEGDKLRNIVTNVLDSKGETVS